MGLNWNPIISTCAENSSLELFETRCDTLGFHETLSASVIAFLADCEARRSKTNSTL